MYLQHGMGLFLYKFLVKPSVYENFLIYEIEDTNSLESVVDVSVFPQDVPLEILD